MSKEKVIQELKDISSSFVNDISTKLNNLFEKFNEFLSKYGKFHSELQQCENFSSHLLTRIVQLERNTVAKSGYSREETIHLFLRRKPIFRLSLNFLNTILEIRLKFSKYFP